MSTLTSYQSIVFHEAKFSLQAPQGSLVNTLLKNCIIITWLYSTIKDDNILFEHLLCK